MRRMRPLYRCCPRLFARMPLPCSVKNGVISWRLHSDTKNKERDCQDSLIFHDSEKHQKQCHLAMAVRADVGDPVTVSQRDAGMGSNWHVYLAAVLAWFHEAVAVLLFLEKGKYSIWGAKLLTPGLRKWERLSEMYIHSVTICIHAASKMHLPQMSISSLRAGGKAFLAGFMEVQQYCFWELAVALFVALNVLWLWRLCLA